MGIVGSLAGGQVQQAKGSDIEKAQHDTAAQSRQSKSSEKAEQATGIGRTPEDAETNERDADGRRLWGGDEEPVETEADDGSQESSGETPQAKDPDGNCGTNLDLTG
jgi:hypothetical protein